ncbi:uncharacterized protein LOC116127306 [Pistacia vera]|uniref:uncharacterized protein LOC116127306 n=1 Tax=Pistacia vera TaxID=55513 RepID=UPI001263AB72|nr:uncharacterized protein LOC116127306 [Pistacia vera]
MTAFLKSIDERAWNACVTGWKEPQVVTEERGSKGKPLDQWTKAELEKSNSNSKALHALFNTVSIGQMKNIANCETAKDAWDRLQVKNERIDMIKKIRLRRLITDYENLFMHDDESITDFPGRLCDITNECFPLGKIYTDAELVRKVLCSLPMKFMSQATFIEECRNLDEIQLDKLIGSLQTFEFNLKRWEKKPGKGLALKYEVTYEPTLSVVFSDGEEDECALLTKKFAKFLKKNMRKPKLSKNGKQPFLKKSTNQLGQGAFSKRFSRDNDKKNKGISKSGCDDTNEDENFLAFTANQEDNSSVFLDDSSDVYKEQKEAYDKMYESWAKAIKEIKSLEFENYTITGDRKLLNDKLNVLSVDLSNKELLLNQALNELIEAKAIVERLNVGSFKLDEVLGQGKSFGDKTGLGFSPKASSSKPGVTTFIKYFDSGCSRHMTSNKGSLIDLEFVEVGHVTYGDGKRGKILGKGSIVIPGFPILNYVFYVEGKKSNDNCYLLTNKVSCLISKSGDIDVWHKKLGHMNFRDLMKLSKKDVAKGLPELVFPKGKVCGPCQQGKQTKFPHKSLSQLNTSCVLEFLHMDLMGPMQTESLGGKRYVFVCVDDFSRFSWVDFLREKSDTFEVFQNLIKRLQVEQNCRVKKVVRIRSDHGKEFENTDFSSFCDSQGIWHEFSTPKISQQNEVVERKNRVLQEMARAMLNDKKILTRLWAKAINTACHIANRVFLRKGTSQTPYELRKGKKPDLSYFHVFACKCYVLNDRDLLGKFDSKSDKGVFLGYSSNSRFPHKDDIDDLTSPPNMTIDHYNVPTPSSPKDVTTSKSEVNTSATRKGSLPKRQGLELIVDLSNEITHQKTPKTREPPSWIKKAHPPSTVIGNPDEVMVTRRKTLSEIINLCYVSLSEPKNAKEALEHNCWIAAMHEELE